MVLLRVFVLGIGILLMSANALGQAVEARVASVSGRVGMSGNARASSSLRSGEVLSPGDVIDTHGGGRVRIEFSDGSVVIVQPETRVVLQDYQSASSLRELLQIVVGRVRIKINHFSSQPNPYRVNSPSASIAVRGTEFSVTVGTGGDTEVVVYEGLVEVSSLSDPRHPVLVEPGRGVIVRPNEPIRFFVPGPDNEIGEREGPGQGRENESVGSAAGIYERYIDSIVDSGETATLSRFAAFPDSHLDSLENPSYATEFSVTEGQVLLLPAFNRTRRNDRGIALFGFGDTHPFDYSLSPQASFFKPFPNYRSVVGGSIALSRNRSQSFTLDQDLGLASSPGSQSAAGSTTNQFFAASLLAARRFGADGRTSIGVGLDFLSQRGSLLKLTNQEDESGLIERERVESRSKVQRLRFTVGMTRNIRSASKLGLFYRYGHASASERNLVHTLDDEPLPLARTGTTANSSEVGFRLRGLFTRRLFYGAEGALFFGRGAESVRQAMVVDSNERSRISRATVGFGIGYAPSPRTVFSFDVSAGLTRARGLRREVATGSLLEDERKTARFLSLHVAVQADVWRQLFVSGSLLSVTQSRVTNLQLFPDRFGQVVTTDGIFVPDGRTRDRFTDYFSNFGVGWRFKPKFVFQYIFSTDFGQTPEHHTFLLRYTFRKGG